MTPTWCWRRPPTSRFADIGGLDEQIERIRDAVQLPFLHRELFERYNLNPPKGVLLYGPPGNGKTLIAKAVAHMLAEGSESGGVFLSVKGPELLNKFVGESERLIRLIFARARERAASGRPVIVFIDEMDSLLRTRGSGVSSDVETTIVPQFLAELGRCGTAGQRHGHRCLEPCGYDRPRRAASGPSGCEDPRGPP